MAKASASSEIEHLIKLLSRLPGLGPRSARRAALHLVKKKETLLEPLSQAMRLVAENVRVCSVCGNIDTSDPCSICCDPARDDSILIVVEDVADLWALERASTMRARYHILGGRLSPLDGIGPDDLNIAKLLERVAQGEVREVILAVNATVEGQTTAHYITDLLGAQHPHLRITRLAHGVPVGGELDYLDDGTLAAAMSARTLL